MDLSPLAVHLTVDLDPGGLGESLMNKPARHPQLPAKADFLAR